MRALLRRLDKRLKVAAMDLLAILMRRRRALAAPDWRSRPHRVLYLRYDRIGDMVLSTGIIREIVAAQPLVTVDVFASTRNADVLRGNPHVGHVYTIDKSRPWTFVTTLARVRRARYDAIVDSIVTAPSLTSMLLMWASGARHRIGLAGRGNDSALTLPVAPLPGAVHYVEHSAALLAGFDVDLAKAGHPATEHLGTDHPEVDHPEVDHPSARAESGAGGAGPVPRSAAAAWRPELFLTAAELSEGEAQWRQADEGVRDVPAHSRPRRLVVNVSAGKAWCYWPEHRFIATIQRVRERYPAIACLIVGAPGDRERMDRIGRRAGVPVAHTGHFRTMMGIVAASDFVLTGDTSVTHIASALRKPVIVMFPANGGALYGPYDTGGRVIATPGPTLDALDLEPVVQALEELIKLDTDLPAPTSRESAGRPERVA